MDPDPQQQQQQLTGVVIISLPPADNPSLGKTITAFTIANPTHPNPSHHAQLSPSPHASSPSSTASPTSAYPMQPTRSHRTSVSLSSVANVASSSSPLKKVRRVLVLFGVAAILILFIHLRFSYARFELFRSSSEGNETRDDGVRSFLFDLHPKSSGGLRPDVEAKLGSFVGRRGRVKRYGKNENAVDSSMAVFSVRGNVYPDG